MAMPLYAPKIKKQVASFTKRFYRTKERVWTFDVYYVTRNNRRKHKCVAKKAFVAMNCTELRTLRQT